MITKVWIDESEEKCVSCGACEAICEAVFFVGPSVNDKCTVKDVDYSKYEEDIRDAIECCPCGIIKMEENDVVPEIKEEPRKQINVLSFEDAVDILRKRLPEDYVFYDKIDAPLCEATYGNLSTTSSVRAVWRKPSKPLTKFSGFDVCVDREYLRYKMFFRDLMEKPVKSRLLKVQLAELTVDQFNDFVSRQIGMSNE